MKNLAPALRRSSLLQVLILASLTPGLILTPIRVGANPLDPNIVAGNVNFQGLGTASLDINNASQMAIINWQSFSIDAGEATRVNQGANAFTLNRVVSGNPSAIYGLLQASNGGVAVINPNGIVVGPGGVVDVAGMMVMSTLDIDDDDFLNGGESRFYGDSTTGVSNFGTISSASGDVVLLGGFVKNEGQIGALNGTVAIGSGGDIILHEGGGSKISVRGSSDYTGTGIDNSGTIHGAAAEMKAHGNVYALAINNGGAIRATGADRSNGRVRLMASGGSSNINLGGRSSIYATAGSDGGSIEVNAGQGAVTVGGRVDASGAREGGTISVVGNTVTQAEGAVVVASGGQAAGSVAIDAVETVAIDGAVRAESADGTGGNVAVTGRSVLINDNAEISANGSTAGGVIRIGGDFQGRDTGLREADSTRVEAGARITADSTGIGNAGMAIVWANEDTMFLGDISASSRGASGNGGLVEVSGRRFLHLDGTTNANAVNGKSGSVLLDPGTLVVGDASGVPPVGTSFVTVKSINDSLQAGTNVLLVTSSGNIVFNNLGGGGFDDTAATGAASNRHNSIQWTNSNASFGAFASGSVIVNNHIRTSGAGSINLIGGWGGAEGDAIIATAMGFPGSTITGDGIGGLITVPGVGAGGGPQAAFDAYINQGQFGILGGGVSVGSTGMLRHVEVGSRFGDTNVAGFRVLVQGSDNTSSSRRYAMIGFHDGGQAFAPMLNKAVGAVNANFRLDMKAGAASSNGAWLLADGVNAASGGATANQTAAGFGDPIVAIVGWFEKDVNADGIMDGVSGFNSTGEVAESFVPYANHYNSVSSGNWWWQQIEDAGSRGASIDGVVQTADPLGLGGLRPEYGAGIGSLSTAALALAGGLTNGADINVIARQNVELRSSGGPALGSAMIGHGGMNAPSAQGGNSRQVGEENVSLANFSHATVHDGQMERRWSFNNGGINEWSSTAIGRLAPVYGNINVLAGVNNAVGGSSPITIDHTAGTVSGATLGTSGNVLLQAGQPFATALNASDSAAQIGHGGFGQFGEFYGDIDVRAGGNVTLLAGAATRGNAVIGHSVFLNAYWNNTTVLDQQLRFYATTGDYDNPNLRRGELFSGVVTTGFDPSLDPAEFMRYTPANFEAGTGAVGHAPIGKWINIVTREIINMNPLLYSKGYGVTAYSSAASSQGREGLAPLTLAPVSTAVGGALIAPALDGSVVNGFHGNITVVAQNGDVTVQGYNTQGITANTNAPRDSRWAAIGHGGNVQTGLITEGAGYQNAFPGNTNGAPSVGNSTIRTKINFEITAASAIVNTASVVETREVYDYRVNTGGPVGESGSRSQVGAVGTAINRFPVFTTITGDIDVRAGRDITLTGGNDHRDFVRIGHGGVTVADYETSSFILGDIKLDAGRDVNVLGGGTVTNTTRGGNWTQWAYAHVGHGGYRSGFFGMLGDIQVDAGNNVLVRGGAHSWDFAKIGHQGIEDWGGSGGGFSRTEHFVHDNIETNIISTVNATTARVDYSNNHATRGMVSRDFTIDGIGTGSAGTLVETADVVGGAGLNTANIQVNAAGSVTVEHMQEGIRQPVGRPGAPPATQDSQTLGVTTQDSFAQIGHGGLNTGAFANSTTGLNNTATNYTSKVGNISVIADAGNISVFNGTGTHRWSRIGHGVGRETRVDDGIDLGFSRAMVLAGDIRIDATNGDIVIDAEAADENERIENTTAVNVASPNPSTLNPAAIGHGGVNNNLDVVVLSNGEGVNGIAASSDITAIAGGNMLIRGGKGAESSFAQLGHGYSSDNGNDAARVRGQATGFAGDINVNVTGDLLIKGGDNAWSENPNGLSGGFARSVHGAFGAIGHGGYQLDAPSSGNITVYVGNDLAIRAQERTDLLTAQVDNPAVYTYQNPITLAVSSVFNFAKIGHFSVENGNKQPANFNDVVGTASQTGDITVVVNRDLLLRGGTTPNVDDQSIYGAFAQIGHGGPGIGADLSGNITVVAKGNIDVIEGARLGDPGTVISNTALNNYAMIGNGDVIYDSRPNDPSALFRRSALGNRSGNISVAAGNNAFFDGSVVGHADPAIISPNATSGNTTVAVSRLNPFYGGTGTLRAVNNASFSSGNNAAGQMKFFMPARSNNLLTGTTRINEGSALNGYAGTPANFAGLDVSQEELAGREDEVYLTPDLWWDQLAAGAAAGIPGGDVFPIDATSGQGGAIADVDTPGGAPNLVALTAGALGSSATIYRDNNGVSGAGLYTLYYDAILPVSSLFPVPPTIPVPVPVPVPVVPLPPYSGPIPLVESFDVIDRDDPFLVVELTGQNENELFSGLARSGEGNGSNRIEDTLDGFFGSRRDRYSEEEEDEEEERRRTRDEAPVGPLGLTYYVYEPGMNKLSSNAVFGTPPSPEAADPFSYLLWKRDHDRGETPPPVVQPTSAPSPIYDPFSGAGNP